MPPADTGKVPSEASTAPQKLGEPLPPQAKQNEVRPDGSVSQDAAPKLEYVSPTRAVPPAQVLATLSNGLLVKQRIPRMRACDQRNEKGKMCQGHLKRVFEIPEEVEQRFGRDVELYRCERCRTLYLPNPEDPERPGMLRY
jgi:hypothetical protein